MTKEQWIVALGTAILDARIECTPGSYHSKLSYRRVVRLVGSVQSIAAISAPHGSLKRQAIEAEHRSKRPRLDTGTINFGCQIPFTSVPTLIQDGFAGLYMQFSKASSNRRVLEHYQTAYGCLGECLGSPLCDVMLMLVLTLASSTVTPTVEIQAQAFSKGRNQNKAIFAATLVTKMLWFLQPQSFPWQADIGGVLRVPEMVKKIGKTLFRLHSKAN